MAPFARAAGQWHKLGSQLLVREGPRWRSYDVVDPPLGTQP